MSLQQPEAPAAIPEFEVVAGLPSSTELAAVAAVIASLTEELEDAHNARGRIVSAWQRSQRSIRKPIAPGAGAWRSFSG
ncbi:MAG: acyl-CoA carboxylase subunit epsilon [Actinomycetota bacterium]